MLQGFGTPLAPFSLDIYTCVNALAGVHRFLRLLLPHEGAKLSWELHLGESELQQRPEILPIPTNPPSVMSQDYYKKQRYLCSYSDFLLLKKTSVWNKMKHLQWERCVFSLLKVGFKSLDFGLLQCRNHSCARWPHYKQRSHKRSQWSCEPDQVRGEDSGKASWFLVKSLLKQYCNQSSKVRQTLLNNIK